MTLRRLVAVVVITLFVTGAAGAAALDNGSLVGTVTNGQAPLPGVTITLTGPGVSYVQVTNQKGEFKFPVLGPGSYKLNASLQGSSTVELPDLVIRSGRRTELEVTLTPKSTVEDVISVTAESPLLDQRRFTTGTTTSPADLEKIPTARDPWAILQQTPGVLLDRINVGGNEAGRHSVFTGPGAKPGQGVWFLDGVTITDMSDRGRSPLYFDFDSFEEIQVTTGGSATQLTTPGVTLDIVTKRGTNEWRGSGRYYLSDGAFRSGFSYDDQPADDAAPRRNRIVDVNDFGAEIGGPIIKNRLWIWGSYGDQSIDLLTRPTDGEFPATGSYSSTFGSFNFLGTPNNRLSATIHLGRSALPDLHADSRPFDSTWNQDASLDVVKVEETHIFSSNFYLTGMYARINGGFDLVPHNTDAPAYFDNGFPVRSYYQFTTHRSANEFKLDASQFFDTGSLSHELKFGVGYRGYGEVAEIGWPGEQFSYTDGSQTPIVVLPPIFQYTAKTSYTRGYVQDTLTFGNLTANLGLRFDKQSGENERSATLANPERPTLVPGGESQDPGPRIGWGTSLGPRLGLTYALGSERKTLLRASYSRFADQLGLDLIKASNTTDAVPQDGGAAAQYLDANGNHRLDANENTTPFIIIGGVRTDDPRFYESFTHYAAGLRAPATTELILGASTEVNRDWIVGANFRHRQYVDAIEELGLVREPNGTIRAQQYSDFVAGQPAIGTDFAGEPFNVPTFQLRNNLQTVDGVEVTNGDHKATYMGMSVQFSKRLANRWLLRGHLNFDDWGWTVPESSVTDPNSYLKFGDADGEPVAPRSDGDGKSGVFINSGWSWNVQGMYQIAPDRPWGFNLATSIYGRQGYPGPASATISGSDFVVREILVGDPDRRYDNIFIADLSASKRFGFDRFHVTLGVDAFNLFNNNAVLQQDRDATSAFHTEVTEIVSPRILRLGVRLNWK